MTDNGRLRGRWQAYTVTDDLTYIRRLFEARHGCPPAEVIVAGCILLAGPIVTDEQEVLK